MPSAKTDKWSELRKPFKKDQIGKLPRGDIQLDYVGHANVTDRLLEVDPEWTWEPMARDEHGLPIFTQGTDQFNKPLKQLWIKLTVLGVTRPGVGDGKSEKECIGDAIRNAAMRFGVALDLWSKEELGSQHSDDAPPPAIAKKMATIDEPSPEEPSIQVYEDTPAELTSVQSELKEILIAKGYVEPQARMGFVKTLLGHPIPRNVGEYRQVIAAVAEVPF